MQTRRWHSSSRADGIYAAIGDEHSRARVYGRMGVAHWYRGDVEGVQDAYAEALRRRRAVGDRMLEGATLNGTGSLHSQLLADLDGALDWYGQAIDLRRTIGDLAGLATSLTYKANVHRDLGQLIEARSLYEEARPVLAQLDDPTPVVENIYGTAWLYEIMGRTADAIRLYGEGADLCRGVETCGYAPQMLVEKAELLRQVGLVHDCLATLQEADALLLASRDIETETRVWQVRAMASIDLGDRDAAREHAIRARQLARESENPHLECDVAALVSRLYVDLGAHDRGRAAALDALEIARQLEDPALERFALVALGNVEIRAGNGEATLEALARALEIDEAANAVVRQAEDLLGTGGAYSLMGRTEDARRDLHRAARLFTESGQESALWLAYLNLADSFEESHPDSAAYYYDKALASLERENVTAGGEALNTGYLFASRGHAYEEITRYYAGRHWADPKAGWDARAFETAERSRARGLLDLLRRLVRARRRT